VLGLLHFWTQRWQAVQVLASAFYTAQWFQDRDQRRLWRDVYDIMPFPVSTQAISAMPAGSPNQTTTGEENCMAAGTVGTTARQVPKNTVKLGV
jgi:hypothetical protein